MHAQVALDHAAGGVADLKPLLDEAARLVADAKGDARIALARHGGLARSRLTEARP